MQARLHKGKTILLLFFNSQSTSELFRKLVHCPPTNFN